MFSAICWLRRARLHLCICAASPLRYAWTPILVFWLLGPSPIAQAGAWTKAPGSGYTKLGSSTFVADHAFNAAGERLDSAPFRLYGQTLYSYTELGLFDGGMATLLLPYVITRNQHEAGVGFLQASLGDAQLGAQLRLLQWHEWVGAIRVETKIPLYAGGPSVQGRQSRRNPVYPRNSQYFPAVGDGQIDVTSWLSLSASLPQVDGFVSAESGYRLRFDGVSDSVVGWAQGGIFLLGRRLLWMGSISAVLTLPPSKNDVIGKGYWTCGTSAMFFVTPAWALEFGFDYLTWGVNTAGGPLLQLGVSYGF